MAATVSNRPLTQYSGDTPSDLFIRNVPSWRQVLRRDDAPFFTSISQEAPNKKPMIKEEWGWGSLDPYKDTGITASINSSVTAVPVTSGAMFQVGDTIRIDAEDMLVTSISSNTLTVTRTYGGTNASHTSGATVFRMLPAIMENQATPLSPITQGEVDFNYYQQSEMSVQLSHRATVVSTYEFQDLSRSVKQELGKKLKHTIPQLTEQAMLFGPRNLGSTTSPSSMGGMLTTTSYITTRNTTLSGPLTENNLMTNLQTVWSLVGNGGMGRTIMAHPLVCRVMSSWYNDIRRAGPSDTKIGNSFKTIDTGWFGEFEIMPNYLMESSSTTGAIPYNGLVVYKAADIKYKPLSGDSGWSIEPLPENGWFDLMALRGDFTTKFENPDGRLLLSGFSITESDYPSLS